MASSAKSGMVDSICLAKQADLEAVAFSGTGRRLARAAIGLGFRGWGFAGVLQGLVGVECGSDGIYP